MYKTAGMPATIHCVDLLQMTLFTGPLYLLKYCHWTAGRDSELKDTHTLPYQVKLVRRAGFRLTRSYDVPCQTPQSLVNSHIILSGDVTQNLVNY